MHSFELGRAETQFDLLRLRTFFRSRSVLLTGAAGSIGSALATAIARMGCAELALVDQFDHGLLDVTESIRRLAPQQSVTDILCDIRDQERLAAVVRRARPDIVIHSAALKHVHLGERHAAECVLTNLGGVRNALLAAEAAGTTHFVLISSDKAAAPACVMGATKRLAELHLSAFNAECGGRMRLRSVRFGNVLGTQGSVLPRFAAQIAAGGPIEVTHPQMERFFMTPNEAVGLILSVCALDDAAAPDGAAYVMDMGSSVSILRVAREMIARSGKNIRIEFTGLRPGEKLKEQLFDEYDGVGPSVLPSVFRVMPCAESVSSGDVAYLQKIARSMDNTMVRQRVFALLDERLGRNVRAAG